MPKIVVHGATMKCTHGSKIVHLSATSTASVLTSPGLVASIFDNTPGENIPTFGICKVDHQHCQPITPLPWTLEWTEAVVSPAPAISASSELRCHKPGTISIVEAGQGTIDLGSEGELLADLLRALKKEVVSKAQDALVDGIIDREKLALEKFLASACLSPELSAGILSALATLDYLKLSRSVTEMKDALSESVALSHEDHKDPRSLALEKAFNLYDLQDGAHTLAEVLSELNEDAHRGAPLPCATAPAPDVSPDPTLLRVTVAVAAGTVAGAAAPGPFDVIPGVPEAGGAIGGLIAGIGSL